MRNNKGVTLIALGITIVLIALLAGIVITTSIQSLNNMSLENFKYELEEVQRKVDEISADYTIYKKNNTLATYKDYFTNKFGSSPNLLKDREDKAKELIEANPILKTNKESDLVFYFYEKDIKQYLGLKGIKDIVVDFSTRYVYSVSGCKDPDNNKIYYSAKDYDGSLIVPESNNINSTLYNSTVSVSGTSNLIGNTKIYDMKLSIENRSEVGTNYPITKAYYSKKSDDEEIGITWTEIKDIKKEDDLILFTLYEDGIYQFKVVDSSGALQLSNLIKVISLNEITTEENETVTEMHYIDGRVFYAREINLTTASVAGNHDTNIQIDGIDNICFDFTDSYVYTDSGQTYVSLNTYYTASAYVNAWYDGETHHIMYSVGTQYVNSPVKIIVRYTKVADSPTLSTKELSKREQFTGMYTEDGKKIYSISKETTLANNANNETDINIPEADKVFFDLDYSYMYNETTKNYFPVNTYYSTIDNCGFWFNTKTNNICCLYGTNSLNSKVFLTLRYTKKDDNPEDVTNILDKVLSDQEVFTGKYINGKKVYRISKKFNTSSSAGSNNSTSVTVPNADIIMIDRQNSYLYTDNGNTYTQLNTYFNGNANCQCWFNTKTKIIQYILGKQYVNSEAFITLQYTKLDE